MSGKFEQFEQSDLEERRQEFFARVDAGEFDNIINARLVHELDQEQERQRRLARPTTPDELIEAAEIDMDISEATRMADEMMEKMTEEEKERLEEEKKRGLERFLAFLRNVKEKGDIWLHRESFKKNPKNLEQFLRGDFS